MVVSDLFCLTRVPGQGCLLGIALSPCHLSQVQESNWIYDPGGGSGCLFFKLSFKQESFYCSCVWNLNAQCLGKSGECRDMAWVTLPEKLATSIASRTVMTAKVYFSYDLRSQATEFGIINGLVSTVGNLEVYFSFHIQVTYQKTIWLLEIIETQWA